MKNLKKFNPSLIIVTAIPLVFMTLPKAMAASKADVVAEKDRKEKGGADAAALKRGDKAIKTTVTKKVKLASGRTKSKYNLKENLKKRNQRLARIRKGQDKN